MRERRDLAWAIGLIASCIAIFVFITGWQSIGDISRNLLGGSSIQNNSSSSQETFPTRAVSATTDIPHFDPTPTVRPIPSLTPAPPIDVSSDYPNQPGVSLALVQSPDTGFRIRLEIPGSGTEAQSFLNDASFALYTAVKDITGQWAVADSTNYYNYGIHLESNGTSFVSVSPGDYALMFGDRSNNSQIIGCNFPHPDKYHTTLFFPVQSQYTTEIVFTPARLEVGILSTRGDALQETYMNVNCQGEDISGNPIITNPYCEIDGGWNASCYQGWVGGSTDARGLATFFLAPGKYLIWVWDNAGNVIKREYGIIIGPNEVKQIVVTVDR